MLERGRTLIELLIVLGIVALLTLLAAQGLRAVAARGAGAAAAAELAGELRLARHLAMSRREPVRLRVDPEAVRVWTEPARVPGTVLRLARWSGPRPRFTRLPRHGAVVFYPSGRTASPTTIVLVDRTGRERRITVSLTGRVAIQ